MALHIGIGNFSGAMACNFYRSMDAPRFILGRKLPSICCHVVSLNAFLDGIELMFVGIGLICVPIAVLSYIRVNAKREAIMNAQRENGEVNKLTPREIRMLGDKSPDFRYTL
jgi:hypothetical protein